MYFTDEEYLILSAAIEREREICKEIDKDSFREPYETSLTELCNSISDKIKKLQNEPDKKHYVGRVIIACGYKKGGSMLEFDAPANATSDEIENIAREKAFSSGVIELDYWEKHDE